jgi:hypothetical protein
VPDTDIAPAAVDVEAETIASPTAEETREAGLLLTPSEEADVAPAPTAELAPQAPKIPRFVVRGEARRVYVDGAVTTLHPGACIDAADPHYIEKLRAQGVQLEPIDPG